MLCAAYLVARLCPTPCGHMDCSLPDSARDSPGRNTGVGCHALLQGIFPTQGLNPGLPQCWRTVYHLSHQRSPRVLEWISYPFSSESYWPRSWTRVSCIEGRFFTKWGTREAQCRLMSCATSLWLYPTLCDPVDYSLPGSSVHGILQTEILEWVAMPFSRASSWPRDGTCLSCVSCIGRRVLYHYHHLGSPTLIPIPNYFLFYQNKMLMT